MKIKHITFILGFFVTIWILSNHKGSCKAIASKSSFDSTEFLKMNILGEWGIYGFKTDSSEVLCNVCPKVKFFDNNLAIITNPSNAKRNLNWSLDQKYLIINYLNKNVFDKDFPDSIYVVELIREKNLLELILKQETKGYSLTLRKN